MLDMGKAREGMDKAREGCARYEQSKGGLC